MTDTSDTQALTAELKALRREVAEFNDHNFIRRENSVLRIVLMQFLRGVAYGFGWVVGATIVVSSVVYFLTTIDFIPVIGNWAKEIADMIQESR